MTVAGFWLPVILSNAKDLCATSFNFGFAILDFGLRVDNRNGVVLEGIAWH
jgi:hypothetical protein